MKKLLCLLSAQPVANLLSVIQFLPERLYLVETPGMKKIDAAAHFLTALDKAGLDYRSRTQTLPLQNEAPLDAVNACLSQLAIGPGDQWIVNLTGGTKPMAIGVHDYFRGQPFRGLPQPPRSIYMNISGPGFIDLENGAALPAPRPLTIDEFIAGYGFSVVPSVLEDGKEQSVDRFFECARRMAMHLPLGRILPDVARVQNTVRRQEPYSDGLVCVQLQPHIARFFDKNRPLDMAEQRFLLGDWLEYFFTGLLRSNAPALGLNDVRIGLCIEKTGSSARTEFDVAFMKNNALHMVECKCGLLSNGSPNDLLDRLIARARQFGALKYQSYLVSNSPRLQHGGGGFNLLQERAAVYKVKLLLLDHIHRLAQADVAAPQIAAVMGL